MQLLNSYYADVRGLLATAFSPEHDRIYNNIEHLQWQLKDEKIYSKYFDPFSFQGSMKILKRIIMKQSNQYIEQYESIMDLLTKVINVAQILITEGYNKNLRPNQE